MSAYIAAIDVGTTAAKALLVDAHGCICHPVTVDLQTAHGPNGEVTQRPQAWFEALQSAARQWWAAGIHPDAVAMIAPCGQMQNLVALDRDGACIGDAVLYADRCAVDEAAAVNAEFGAAALHARMGNPLDAGSLPPKLLRWRRQDPAGFARTACVLLSAKDFLTARLTGAWVVDASTASTTGMYCLFDACWDLALLQALQLDAALLPRLVPAGDVAGHVSAAAAALTGFAEGTPVLCGLGDAVATGEGAALATATAGGRYLYLGTSAWIAGIAPLPLLSAAAPPSAGVIRLAGAAPGQMVIIAPALNGGCVLDWSLRLLGHQPGEDRGPYFRQLEAAVDPAPADRTRLPLFLPFLSPERCPVVTEGAGGTFLHIGSHTGRADMLRAVLDGTALALRWCAELLPSAPAGSGPATLPVVGGGIRCRPWLQTIADALDCPLQPQHEADRLAALGVAGLAARRLGWAAPQVGGAANAKSATSATAAATAAVRPAAAGRMRLAAAYPAFRRATEVIRQLHDGAV